eukprot:4926157-Pyramimonas_sp.AAC.1
MRGPAGQRGLPPRFAQEGHEIPELRVPGAVGRLELEAQRRVAEELHHGLTLWSEVDARRR